MAMTMTRQDTTAVKTARRAFGLVAGTMLISSALHAQAQPTTPGNWRFAASAGGYVPRSSVIIAADSNDTRLSSAPVFALDVQYLAWTSVSVYANGMVSFPTISLGSSIQPGVVGPSNQVMLTGGTAGVVLTTSSGSFQPTLRLGGGFKWYMFDLAGAEDQFRPTVDIGLGFRAVGNGPIEVLAEIRYLPSSFDQAKLPTRGITPQEQRQNDLTFTIGVGLRP